MLRGSVPQTTTGRRFTPDVTKIAYAHLMGDGTHDIYVANIDGTGAEDVTNTSGLDEVQPTWSPDAAMLAYARRNVTGTTDYDIAVQPAARGGTVTNLTPNSTANDMDPSWSPKGTQIAFSSNKGHTWPQVWVMDDTGQHQQVLTDAYSGFADCCDQNSDPAFSPDGKKIAFVFSPGGTQNFDVYTMNADGMGRAALMSNGTHEGFPAWAPSGPDRLQPGPSFTVNNVGDAPDPAVPCTFAVCTLRTAINAANAQQGPNTITFSIPGTGVHTISIGPPLPPLVDSGTTIDGYTQPGASENTQATGSNAVLPIHVDGSGVLAIRPAALHLTGSDNTIEGLEIGNALGPGFDYGVQAEGLGASRNVIRGNRLVGMDIFAVDVRASAGDTRIGGPTPGDRNVLSSNRLAGISVSSSGSGEGPKTSGARIEGNQITASRDGVVIQAGAVSNVVTGNEIANNAGNGVGVYGPGGTVHNEIRQNSIHDNGRLGIDLGGVLDTVGDGITQHDSLDLDTGPNDLQNFPRLAPPLFGDGLLSVATRIASTPNTRYTIDVYANSTCDPSNFGEGRRGSPRLTSRRTARASPSRPCASRWALRPQGSRRPQPK